MLETAPEFLGQFQYVSIVVITAPTWMSWSFLE